MQQYNGSNALQRRFVFGPGADAPIVQYEGTGTTDRRFMSSDERGSIIAFTNSSGTLLSLNRYDEYGIPQSSNSGRFGYTGQMYLSEIGLSYYKARFFSFTLGRFLQTDPIGYGDGMNIYAYVRNDPVNATDPSGTVAALSSINDGNDSQSVFAPVVGERVGGFAVPIFFVGGRLDEITLNNASAALFKMNVMSAQTGVSLGCMIYCSLGEVREKAAVNAGTAIAIGGGAAGGLFTPAAASGDITRAYQIAMQELNRTMQVAPPGAGHNDIYDAERHARWVYRMAGELGPGTAQLISDAHEWQNLAQGSPLREIYMDLHNNMIGLQAWQSGAPIPNTNTPGLMYIQQIVRGKGGNVYNYKCC